MNILRIKQNILDLEFTWREAPEKSKAILQIY